PALPDETATLHYLLKTPFRYPPLKWGSRFSGRDLPSLFYGAGMGDTCLAEAAFYRLVFLDSMQGSGEGVAPSTVLRSRHTMFCIGFNQQICGVPPLNVCLRGNV
ncbi:MAG: RES domain-containing protein, partial [Alphaproteobacteria bacterium]|nr:RES domain-containing protein [Alphaproteobacteria bacterium]